MIAHPYLLGGALLGGLYLVMKHPPTAAVVGPPAPEPTPLPLPPPAPAPPAPTPFPDNVSSASVGAPGGLALRSGPNESSARLEILPFNSWVQILDSTTTPPTPAAPAGWFNVKAPSGNVGYASASWIVFGTDKERGMTPEEEAAYHARMSEQEAPVYDAAFNGAPVANALSWTRPQPRFRRSLPMAATTLVRLRNAPSPYAQAMATVAPGELVQVLRRQGGWVLARYRDRHAPQAAMFSGWLPANALAPASVSA